MTIEPGFAFAQPRLQARHGRRLTDAAWREAERSLDLARCLQVLRGSSLRPWVAHIAADTDLAGLERTLRRDWLIYVDSVARWAPADWHPAVEWTATLCYLPLLAHLKAGNHAPRWTRSEPGWQQLGAADHTSLPALLATTALAPLAAVGDDDDVIRAWLAHWQELWPADISQSTRTGLDALEQATLDHLAFVATAAMPDEPAALRSAYAERILRLFRRHAGSAVAMFCHVALTALDVERLRGALIASRLRRLRNAS